MTRQEWEEVEQEVIKFLDSINLISEMIQGRENLKDFMDRLEEKYPFKFHNVVSLFDGFGTEDFEDYLYKRYKNIDCYTQEYTSVDIIKRQEGKECETMKPSKTIREMDSHKLLKEFESVVNKYGGERYDYLGEVMPRYNQNKIKMMRTELFRRLGLVNEESDIPTLNDEFFASVDKSIKDKLTMKYGEVV